MSRILASDKLWICGEHQTGDGGDDWVMVGVYSTEGRAVMECEDESYFVAPIMLDCTPDDSDEWPGYYRPLAN